MDGSGTTKRRPWLGGYIREGKRRPTYVIDRWVSGVHFHVSTRCSTERAALKQLERFEADPFAYSPLREEIVALTITKDLCEAYREHMLRRKRNTPEWVGNVMRFLADWAEDLEGKDLRRLSVQKDLRPAIAKRKTSERHRTEAIKAFCTWLRQERGLLTTASDATLDMPVPKSVAAKTHRRRAVPQEFVRAVLPELPAEARDVMILQVGTAWHVAEARRFAAIGEIVRPVQVPGAPLAVLVTPHKSGDLTRTPIHNREHLAAAERIRLRKRIPIKETLCLQMRAACDSVRAKQAAAGVPEEERMPHFRLGDMRHTVLTWAYEMGASAEQISQFANHRSVETTKKFYLDAAIPTVNVPVLRLLPYLDVAGEKPG